MVENKNLEYFAMFVHRFGEKKNIFSVDFTKLRGSQKTLFNAQSTFQWKDRKHTHTHTLTHTLSLSLSFSNTRTHKHTHTELHDQKTKCVGTNNF